LLLLRLAVTVLLLLLLLLLLLRRQIAREQVILFTAAVDWAILLLDVTLVPHTVAGALVARNNAPALAACACMLLLRISVGFALNCPTV
jgi:hypothetical protein